MRALVRLSACLLLGSSFLPTAWAALGPLTVHSRQGEALRADIALTTAPDGAQVASAPRAFYRSAGADWLPAQQQAVSMRIDRTADGQPVVRLASTRALTDPYLSLVVELSAAGQAPEYRYYTVLLPTTSKEPVRSQGAPVEAPDAAPPARPVPDPENLPGTSPAQVQQPAAASPAPMVSVAELDRIARQEYEAAQARSNGKEAPAVKVKAAGKPAPVTPVRAQDSGWQWSSAAAGAAATLAVLLAGGAGLLWWRRRRNRPDSPSGDETGASQVMTARPPEPELPALPEAPAPVVAAMAPVMAEPAVLEADLSAASSEAALAEALASAEAMAEAAPHPAEVPAPVVAAAEPMLENYEFHDADDGAAVLSATPEAVPAPAPAVMSLDMDMDAIFGDAVEPVAAPSPVEVAAPVAAQEEDLLAAMMEDIHPPAAPETLAEPEPAPAVEAEKEEPVAIDQDSIDDLLAGFSTPAPSVPPAVMGPPPPEPEPPVEEPEPEPEPKAEPSLLEFDFPLEEIQPAPAPLPSDTNGMELDFDNMLDGDPLDTKLALARVYLDMGDGEGAREIVEEVLQAGSEAQRAEARKLLAGMASAG